MHVEIQLHQSAHFRGENKLGILSSADGVQFFLTQLYISTKHAFFSLNFTIVLQFYNTSARLTSLHVMILSL